MITDRQRRDVIRSGDACAALLYYMRPLLFTTTDIPYANSFFTAGSEVQQPYTR